MKWKMMSEEGKLELIIDTKTLDNELLIHCPVCGNPLWFSKEDPNYRFCVNCRRRYIRLEEGGKGE